MLGQWALGEAALGQPEENTALHGFFVPGMVRGEIAYSGVLTKAEIDRINELDRLREQEWLREEQYHDDLRGTIQGAIDRALGRITDEEPAPAEDETVEDAGQAAADRLLELMHNELLMLSGRLHGSPLMDIWRELRRQEQDDEEAIGLLMLEM